MGELRKDYLLDEYVLLSPRRAQRPQELPPTPQTENKNCTFCPGNEHLTPEETGRIPNKKSWQIRWMPNKYPAVEPTNTPTPTTHNTFYNTTPAYGHHEIIIETPHHNKQLWDLDQKEHIQVLEIWRDRINHYEQQPHIKYVTIFKNHGTTAGTSIQHSHSQTIALPFIPTRIQAKLHATRKYVTCPHCSIIEQERNSERFIMENNKVIAFTPYASRYPYETWILPTQHNTRLDNTNIPGIAQALHHILTKLRTLNAPYNITLTYAPHNTNLHLHLEITPRLATFAGFEISTDTIINTTTPEDSARYYRP